LQSIVREAVRCKNLVQGLLTFSRIENAEKEYLDLKSSLESALSLVKAQTTVSDIEFDEEIQEGLPEVAVNRNQFQQVIINLCNNAVDAMPWGGRLAVRMRGVQDQDKEWVQVEVVDTGTGMTKEVRERIFEPFFTTKEVGKGTGLGLSLVYEIVRKHEGSIAVESQPGQGATFTVRFPSARSSRIA
jgi:signal transduction histidine kinase